MANALIWLFLLVHAVVGDSLAGYLPRANAILGNSSGQNTLSASTTAYMSPTGNKLAFESDEFQADVRFGRAITIRNFYCSASNSQTGSNSITITARNNHADTTVTCQMTGGASTCNDVT